MREFESSHSNPLSRIIKITHAHDFHMKDVGICPFYSSYVIIIMIIKKHLYSASILNLKDA